MTNTKLQRSRMMENYQVRFCSQGEKGDHLSLDNEMLDYICWKHYGYSSGAVEVVLEANPGLAEYDSFLPAGIKIKLPKIQKISQEPVTNILE